MPATAREVAQYLDKVLSTALIKDYSNAINGLQFEHSGPVRKIGAAVDFSLEALRGAIGAEVNFILVHHGMFWSGLQPLVGSAYERVRLLLTHDVAVYASHLPLDAHPSLGNAVLFALELGLSPSLPFAHVNGTAVGVAGEADIGTAELLARADAFARRYDGTARSSAMGTMRRTRRWAICTGAGASSDTMQEARMLGVDTLIVGEGPHHTAVGAPEQGLVIIFAGHYATETFGVCAAAQEASRHFSVPWQFIHAPTGL
jgi:dinuclear metal center YbgI/SA1388 family protein